MLLRSFGLRKRAVDVRYLSSLFGFGMVYVLEPEQELHWKVQVCMSVQMYPFCAYRHGYEHAMCPSVFPAWSFVNSGWCS